MTLEQLDEMNKEELSMIECAYAFLNQRGEITDFAEILQAVQAYLEMSDEETDRLMSRFHTDINIDGRFISLGDNRWGLRSWYAIDEINEETIQSSNEEVEPRRKTRSYNVLLEDDDMIDYTADDPEDEDFDADDEDSEELDEYESDLNELGEDEVEDGVDIDEDDDYDDDDEEY